MRYAETDQMGVVYHSNYLVWCEIGRTDFIRTLGTPYAQLERMGVLLAVSDVTLRCLASERYDDPIRIFTRLTEVRARPGGVAPATHQKASRSAGVRSTT